MSPEPDALGEAQPEDPQPGDPQPGDPEPGDPFGTAALRDGVTEAWRQSPTRFTEDANAEEDLRLGAYANRMFVELAANAADAATRAGSPGRMRIYLAGSELRVANTGAALDRAGVESLASLRASAKAGKHAVGRFGVGFAAVLGLCSAPRVISRTGGVAFSAERTAAVAAGLAGVAGQLAQRGGGVPVLRLPYPPPADEPELPEGFDTEVRLPLDGPVDAAAVLAEIDAQVEDVLLTLPALARVEVGDIVWARESAQAGDADAGGAGAGGGDADAGGAGVAQGAGQVVEITRDAAPVGRWLLHAASGRFDAEQAATLGVEAAASPRWDLLWALPVDEQHAPQALGEDVLHAPSPTDERLSVPARLIAHLPVEPSRRRVRAGPATRTVLQAAAGAYHELVTRLPARHRLALVPAAGLARSQVDEQLRDGIFEELRIRPWLPAAAGEGALPAGGARVLAVESLGLAELLGQVHPDLAGPPAVGQRAARTLAVLGAEVLPLGEALDALAGLDREPTWWHGLYEFLDALATAREVRREELGGLPVVLASGRAVPGAAGALLPAEPPSAETPSAETPSAGPPPGGPPSAAPAAERHAALAAASIPGLRVVHPQAAHPLLERLGARRAAAPELLELPELRAAVEASVADAEAGTDTGPLARLVLDLVTETGAHVESGQGWLSALALPAASGELRRADELVLPDARLRAVLDPAAVEQAAADPGAVDPTAPLALTADSLTARWPAETLRAVGVLERFAVLGDEDPAGPDHELPDEPDWWDQRPRPPARVLAVADLDLVAEDSWPEALRLLAAEPGTWRALAEPGGHTGWWIARFALLGGHPPRHWRLPQSEELSGLYDPAPEVGLDLEVLAAAGVRSEVRIDDTDDARDLLARLADPRRRPRPGAVLRAHAALAELASLPGFDLDSLDPPEAVRTLDGGVATAERACVLDAPWFVEVADLAACAGALTDPEGLAEVLDLPLAGEVYSGEVVEHAQASGRLTPLVELPAVRSLADLAGAALPGAALCVHEQLLVRLDGQAHPARWWVDTGGQVHSTSDPGGLARACAHLLGQWDSRHLFAALLADPAPHVLLG